MLFSKDEYMQRLRKVKESMAKKGIDVLLVTNPANICYTIGYDAWSFYVHQIVVIAQDEEMPYFIGRYMDAFAGVVKMTYLDEKHVFAYPDFYVQNPECHPMDFMSDVLKDLGYANKTIGVEMDSYYFTAMAFESLKKGLPDAKFVNGDLIVNWVKIIKSDAEVDLIRKAGKVVDNAMRIAADMVAPGVRQCDVGGAIMGAQMRGTDEISGDYSSIAPLTPYGKTAGAPHPTPDDQVYENGTTMFIEIAGIHKRYHCPMSRTFVIGKAEQRVYDAAQYTIEGLEAALAKVKPGNLCEDVEAAWRETVAKYGIEKESRIGYSTGLNYPPDWGEHTASLRPGDMTVLQPNMVFHCIPGVYYPDFGISISQCFRVTETGCERMSSFPFELIQK